MAKKADYGRGNPSFLEYQKAIVNNPVYRGMPDVYTDSGDIQWEAPSNRTGGKFKDTHHKRREWWKVKALEVGIDPSTNQWISRTAKLIHPTKNRPCKVCGRVMDIRYVYPNYRLVGRIQKLSFYDDDFIVDPLEDIFSLIARLVERYGDQVYDELPSLLKSLQISPPNLGSDFQAWMSWVENDYIITEPSLLSPGAMANPPDRLDGFHSFNLCCRSSSDRGRSKENLKTYTTDRRVFEYWVDGDWIAADRMMSLVRSIPNEVCANGHPGPCQADHIGPISLGFSHRPEFRLLCKQCNSGKNNRMGFQDIIELRRAELSGDEIASWYIKSIWRLAEPLVTDDETALRLSKILRDNRHNAMVALNLILNGGHYVFLASLLNLNYANSDVKFEGFHIDRHLTKYSKLVSKPRTVKYALEQKVRRLRVAFTSLSDYASKENRNGYVISTDNTDSFTSEVLLALTKSPNNINELNSRMVSALDSMSSISDYELGLLVEELEQINRPESFNQAMSAFQNLMEDIANSAILLWNDDRYVRSGWDERI